MRILSVAIKIFNPVQFIRVIDLLLLRLFCRLVNRLIPFCFLWLFLLKLIDYVDFVDRLP